MTFDFIKSWLDWGDPLPAPKILRLWAGIGAISAILSRRIWLQPNSRLPPLYPNLFIMLVAPPRVGKDLAINSAAKICVDANTDAKKRFGSHIIHFGGESISPKGLLDKLNDAQSKQTIQINSKESADIHSLCFFIGETTTAIYEYNVQLIGIMNDLWNCKPQYGESIRGIDFTIKNPHLMLLLGNQPDTLYRIFPESVFKMGFTARLFLIYAHAREKKKVYLETHEEDLLDKGLYERLVRHLADISQWSGELRTTKGFREAVNDFEQTDPCPVPGSRFEHWNGGRGLNTQKLAMCLAASAGEQEVNLRHWERAVRYLFDAEQHMPQIFDNVTTDRGFSEDLERIADMTLESSKVTQYRLLSKLARTRPPHEAAIIIEQAIRAGILIPALDEGGAPIKPLCYHIKGKPKPAHTLQ